MVNSEHSVKLKSRNINDSQATLTTSDTNEDNNSFKEIVKNTLNAKTNET